MTLTADESTHLGDLIQEILPLNLMYVSFEQVKSKLSAFLSEIFHEFRVLRVRDLYERVKNGVLAEQNHFL